MLSCAEISLLMFLRRLFSKTLQGLGRAPLLRFDGISFGSLKIWPPVQIYCHSYKKNLIDLPHEECYAKVLNYLLLKQSNSFRFLRQYHHYYEGYINPAAIKIRKHLEQILLSGICLNVLCFRSNAFQCQWCQCGQQKWYRVHRTCL